MQNIVICEGDSVIIGASIYYNNGIYTDTIISVTGCDSVSITELAISDPLGNLSFSTPLLNAFAIGGTLPYYFELGNQNGMIINSLNNFNTTISINPITNGIYYFFIIDANNCISDTVFYQVNVFPSSFLDFQINDLFIYPNPSRDMFNISFESLSYQDLEINLTNIIGKEIFSDRFNDFYGKYFRKIDLTNNSKGIYFLKINTENGIINKKLILH